jgi:HEAT repeat protein
MRRCAIDALGAIGGEAAVLALGDALKDSAVEARRRAADALRMLGAEAKAATPALIGALKDEDAQVRWNAAHALGGIGGGAKAAAPALIDVLKDGAIGGRIWLGKYDDEDESVGEAAAWALRRIDPEAANRADVP